MKHALSRAFLYILTCCVQLLACAVGSRAMCARERNTTGTNMGVCGSTVRWCLRVASVPGRGLSCAANNCHTMYLVVCDVKCGTQNLNMKHGYFF